MSTPTRSHHNVKTAHLQRDACLYVRQSSMRQILSDNARAYSNDRRPPPREGPEGPHRKSLGPSMRCLTSTE